MKKQISYKIVSLVFSVLVVCFAITFYVVAWNEPVAPPPGGDIPTPLNTGDTTQYKSGALGIGGVFRVYSNTIIDGNVGIGMTEPNSTLDILSETARTGSHATSLGLYVTANSSPAAGGVEFRHYNGTQGIGFGYNTIYATGSNTNQNLILQSRGTSPLTLNASVGGNVGIGTTNPSQKLDVSGQIHATQDICTDAGEGVCLSTAGGGRATYVSGWVSRQRMQTATFNHDLGTDALMVTIQVRYGGVIHQQHASDYAGWGLGVEAYEITSTQIKISTGEYIRYFTSTGQMFNVPVGSSADFRVLAIKMD